MWRKVQADVVVDSQRKEDQEVAEKQLALYQAELTAARKRDVC